MAKLTLIDLSNDQLPSYPSINSMNRSNRSCNTIEDPFGRMFVSNKIGKKYVNLKVFNIK